MRTEARWLADFDAGLEAIAAQRVSLEVTGRQVSLLCKSLGLAAMHPGTPAVVEPELRQLTAALLAVVRTLDPRLQHVLDAVFPEHTR